jgi:hemerythrin-like domain-containing protein
MDALAFLRADHESVLGMFEGLDANPGSGEAELQARNNMVTTLVIAESQHEAIEQQHFWPAVRQALPDGDALADRAIEQEDSAKHTLQKLEDGHAGDPEFEAALINFITAARKHIEFEQNTVWPLVQDVMSADELTDLGAKLEQAKAMAPTRPHPNTPSDPTVLETMGAGAAMVDKARDKLTGRDDRKPPPHPNP